MALSPNDVCGILLGPSCGNPYNPWNQTCTVKLPPPQSHQWCQSPLQRYVRTCIHLLHVWEYDAITEGGSCAARADSHAAHSLQPGSPVSKVLYLSDIHFDKNYTARLMQSAVSLCAADRQTDHHVSLSASTRSNSCTRCDRSPPLPVFTLVLLQLLVSVQPAPGVTATVTVPCRPWRPCCSMSAT